MKMNTTGCWLLSLAMGISPSLHAQTPTAPPSGAAAPTAANAPAPFSQGELEAMVAPVALYPDALLSQMLMASTYPLEIVEAARWRKANASLKDKALEDALAKQSWDASVKSLTAFPDVLSRMNEDLAWTQKLGDAFLGQQKELLGAVQALRQKAQSAGNLESNDKQVVKVETQESQSVIVIEPANPQVVYVPTYQPTVVYGAWAYPAYPPYYPPYWYPVGGAFVRGFAWGVGIAAAGALWGGCNWGRGDVNINVNKYNNFNRTNISNSNWNHDGNRRGSVPYRDQGSREKFGSHDRQAAQARDQFRGRDDGLGGGGLQDRQGLQQARNDPAVRDNANRDRQGAGDRGGAGSRDLAGDRGGAGSRDLASNRGGPSAGTRDLGGAGGGAGANRAATADRGGAFSGGNGASTRSASNRGHSSMSGVSRGGGGAARGGGGGRGGGGRR
jgi:hypothetical protein